MSRDTHPSLPHETARLASHGAGGGDTRLGRLPHGPDLAGTWYTTSPVPEPFRSAVMTLRGDGSFAIDYPNMPHPYSPIRTHGTWIATNSTLTLTVTVINTPLAGDGTPGRNSSKAVSQPRPVTYACEVRGTAMVLRGSNGNVISVRKGL